MGKSIIQQARGKGGPRYRVRKRAFMHKISYPMKTGEAQILELIHSAGHSAPLMKLEVQDEIFHIPAFNGAVVGDKISIGETAEPKDGSILSLKKIPTGVQIYNIEKNPGDGGKMMRAAGTSATLVKKLENNKVIVLTGRKREVILNENCRAAMGKVAGDGKVSKPFFWAGRKYYKMKARNKLYPRTSAIKVNAVDHPFGSGRGKRPKSKIAKRNAPPGRRVGHVRPRKTGWKK